MRLRLILFSLLFSIKLVLSRPSGNYVLPEIPVKDSLIDVMKNYSFFVGITLTIIIVGFLASIYYVRRYYLRKRKLSNKKQRKKLK